MRAGITVSVALHAAVMTASVVALPRAPAVPQSAVAIPVTLVTAAAPQPQPIEPTPPKPIDQPEPMPTADLKPVVDDSPIADETMIPDSQSTTVQDQAQQRLASRFESILKSVESLQKNDTTPYADPFDLAPSLPDEPPEEPPTDTGDTEENGEETLGSSHLQSLVKLRIERDCWRDPSDMADAARLNARISFTLNRDGNLNGPPRLLSPGSVSRDASLRVFIQRAFRAIRACAPYDFLPPERYSEWRRIVVNFSGVPK